MDVSGIPNMGFGGGAYFGGNGATNPAMSADQINAGMGWNPYAQASATDIYGSQGFGGLTNYYSSLGAAYGRATGGFNNAASPSGTVTRGTDLPAPPSYNQFGPVGGQADRIRAIYGPGALSGLPGGENARDTLARTMFNPYAHMYGPPTNGPYPNLGYNPGMSNWFANPGMNGNPFQNRFGLGFPGQGTPSQVYPDYGGSDTLTPMDRLGDPYKGPGGGSGSNTGVGVGG